MEKDAAGTEAPPAPAIEESRSTAGHAGKSKTRGGYKANRRAEGREPCRFCGRPVADTPAGRAQHEASEYCLTRKYYHGEGMPWTHAQKRAQLEVEEAWWPNQKKPDKHAPPPEPPLPPRKDWARDEAWHPRREEGQSPEHRRRRRRRSPSVHRWELTAAPKESRNRTRSRSRRDDHAMRAEPREDSRECATRKARSPRESSRKRATRKTRSPRESSRKRAMRKSPAHRESSRKRATRKSRSRSKVQKSSHDKKKGLEEIPAKVKEGEKKKKEQKTAGVPAAPAAPLSKQAVKEESSSSSSSNSQDGSSSSSEAPDPGVAKTAAPATTVPKAAVKSAAKKQAPSPAASAAVGSVASERAELASRLLRTAMEVALNKT